MGGGGGEEETLSEGGKDGSGGLTEADVSTHHHILKGREVG